MKTQSTAVRGEFTGKHMLFLAVGFFGVIIAVNVTMAVISSTSWTGLVVENSYVASQEFDSKRDDHLKQIAAGWQSDLVVDRNTVNLRIVDGEGKPVDLGVVTVLVNRPVGGHDDQNLTLTRLADGSYSSPVTLTDGVWDAWVTAERTGLGFYELHERLKLGEAAK